MGKLKPCPCCNGKAATHKDIASFVYDKYFYKAYCTKCGLTTQSHMSLEDAIKAWNRRAGNEDYM